MRRRGARALRPVPALAVVLATLTGCPNDPVVAAPASTTILSTTAPTSTAASTTAPTSTAATSTATAPQAVPAEGDLYAEPPDVGDRRPGELLRYQRVEQPLDLSGGIRWRVMYTSSDHDGRTIAVTGLVRVPAPATGAPAPPWSVLAWAHGTTGSADRCAPSVRLTEPAVADPLVADGLVIASTDYAGLGGPGLHPYLDGEIEGRSVLDLVAAVDDLPEVRTDRRFAVWGHSQGGHAALFARELAAERLPGHRLVGTVAIAPPALIASSMTGILEHVQPKAFPAMALAGIAATHPDARLGDVLTPAAATAVANLADAACADEIGRALTVFGSTSIVRSAPDTTPPWDRYLAAMEPATRAGTGPLLLVHASDDRTVPAFMSATVKERACARGEVVTRWLAAGGGHSGVVAAAVGPMRRWTLDRFAGAPADDGCASTDGPIA